MAALAIVVVMATAGRWDQASRLFDPSSPSAGRLSGDEVAYLLLGDRLLHEGRYTTRGIEHMPGLESASLSAYCRRPSSSTHRFFQRSSGSAGLLVAAGWPQPSSPI